LELDPYGLRLLDTITNEVTYQITCRIPRVYTRNGEMIGVKNYLT